MPSPALFAPHRRHSAAPPSDWWAHFEQQRDLDMPRQSYSWTCSACAIDWVARASGLDPHSNREQVVGEIGYGTCITPDDGLLDTRCAMRVMEAWGVPVTQEWVTFERALELCGSTTGILNNAPRFPGANAWTHFVAVRGVIDGGRLWIANSASGYRDIGDSIDRRQWDQFTEGAWQIVYLERA